jgi:hypothetical protein
MKRMTGLGWIVAMGILAGCHDQLELPTPGAASEVGDQGPGDAAPLDGSSGPADGGTTTDDASPDAASDAANDAAMVAPGDASMGFTFEPSNIDLGVIAQYTGASMPEVTVGGPCLIHTDTKIAGGCAAIDDTVAVVQQTDPVTAATSPVELLVVQSLTVNGTITVTGPTPIIIVSLTNVTFGPNGSLLGNSETESGGKIGPGGGAGGQPSSTGIGPGGGAASGETTGAGGGSYCGVGGAGGGGTVSSAYGAPEIRPLVGGSGGAGGSNSDGGEGGGAIQIVAAGSITMAAGSLISVSGAAGQGIASCAPDNPENAGGAGSGGSILLEAPTVSIAGALVSNGGAGAGGIGGATPDGQDGWFMAPLSSASTPAVPGGVGGAGSAGTTVNGASGQPSVACMNPDSYLSAGSGGGGAGRLRINTRSVTPLLPGATISPDPSTACFSQGPLRGPDAGP